MVIDDEGRNVKEHGRNRKNIMKTELTMDEDKNIRTQRLL